MPEDADALLPFLEYLERDIDGRLTVADRTHLRHPTAISQLLGLHVVRAGVREAAVRMTVDPVIHGNQQGTVHGGTIAELADAAIGTAHSTVIEPGESFATIELAIRFLRPVWTATLTASAVSVHAGQTIAHYRCEIVDDSERVIAIAESSLMTLRGEAGDRSRPRDRR